MGRGRNGEGGDEDGGEGEGTFGSGAWGASWGGTFCQPGAAVVPSPARMALAAVSCAGLAVWVSARGHGPGEGGSRYGRPGNIP